MTLFGLGQREAEAKLTEDILLYEGEWVLISEDGKVILAHAKELKDIIDDGREQGRRGSFMKVPPRGAILIPGVYGV